MLPNFEESLPQSASAAPPLLDGYIPEIEWCQELGIVPRTARLWRQQGDTAPYIEVAQRIYYSIEGTRAWLKRREKSPPRSRRVA